MSTKEIREELLEKVGSENIRWIAHTLANALDEIDAKDKEIDRLHEKLKSYKCIQNERRLPTKSD